LSKSRARPERAVAGCWLLAAAASSLFAIWSGYAGFTGGWAGFWPLHQAGVWGNQIWFDLLLAVGAAWSLLLPRARSVGMRVVPWTLFVLATGSIGLCAMLARCLYLEASPQGEAGGDLA
jgi:hypothetical protein